VFYSVKTPNGRNIFIQLPKHNTIDLANNKLKTMAGLRHLSKLRKIDLGANRLRVMDEEELSGLQDLEELWLGKNKIERIGGISKVRLKQKIAT